MLATLEHILLRLLARHFLERRLEAGPLSPWTRAKLKDAYADLIAAYRSAQVFFEGIGMCRGCEVGCCGGSFSRFSVYDRIAHEVGGVNEPPKWGYRLHLFGSYRKNCEGKEEGWCSYFVPGHGCGLPQELKSAMCVWSICERMRRNFSSDQKIFVRNLRRRIDRVLWRFAFTVVLDEIWPGRRRSFWHRLVLFWQGVEEAGRATGKGTFGTAWAFVRQRLFLVSETLLYVRDITTMRKDVPLPPELVVTPASADDPETASRLIAAGLGWSVRQLGRRKRTAYLATWQGNPAGVAWLFERSRLLRRIGLGAGSVYLGGFEVLNEYRRRGIYTAMIEVMCRDAAARATKAYAETEADNIPSRRGLEKAGFHVVGELRTVIVCGALVWWRLRPWIS